MGSAHRLPRRVFHGTEGEGGEPCPACGVSDAVGESAWHTVGLGVRRPLRPGRHRGSGSRVWARWPGPPRIRRGGPANELLSRRLAGGQLAGGADFAEPLESVTAWVLEKPGSRARGLAEAFFLDLSAAGEAAPVDFAPPGFLESSWSPEEPAGALLPPMSGSGSFSAPPLDGYEAIYRLVLAPPDSGQGALSPRRALGGNSLSRRARREKRVTNGYDRSYNNRRPA